MSKKLSAAVLSIGLLVGCAATGAADRTIRIDGSSPEAAEASYRSMMNRRSEAGQRELALAVLLVNMEGVQDAHEALNNPELDSPSIGRIRAKVAGMTAEQIIERGRQNRSIRIEPAKR